MVATIRKLDNELVEISTSRLYLRAAQPSDAVSLHESFSDMEVMRYWSTLPHENQAKTEEWVSKMIGNSQNGVTDFIICLKPDLTPVGKIGVWQGDEVGFLLAKNQWGKGLAQEALRAVLAYFFNDRGFEQVIADIEPENKASHGLLKKLGFQEYDFQEKNFERAGEMLDSLYLKLTKSDYMQLVELN